VCSRRYGRRGSPRFASLGTARTTDIWICVSLERRSLRRTDAIRAADLLTGLRIVGCEGVTPNAASSVCDGLEVGNLPGENYPCDARTEVDTVEIVEPGCGRKHNFIRAWRRSRTRCTDKRSKDTRYTRRIVPRTPCLLCADRGSKAGRRRNKSEPNLLVGTARRLPSRRRDLREASHPAGRTSDTCRRRGNLRYPCGRCSRRGPRRRPGTPDQHDDRDDYRTKESHNRRVMPRLSMNS